MSSDLAGRDLLARVEELISDDLVQADACFRTELQSWHPYVTDVLQHATQYRGKRLRPILLLTAASACGAINERHHVLAAVVEMIHTATLVHDDVLDDATTRRHVATVNARWNNETSVLCGDYLFTHAFHLTSSLGDATICRLIGRATNMICEGELSQIHERGNLDLNEDTYFRIINGKTAELCALSSFLGSYLSDQDEPLNTGLQEYGRLLGMAFQVTDDLIDILGDENQTGKSLGTDFKKQKLTLPIIRLMSQVEPPERGLLREILGRPNEHTWSEIQPFLDRTDAVEYAQQRASKFAADARKQLSGLPNSAAKTILEDLTEFACRRAS